MFVLELQQMYCMYVLFLVFSENTQILIVKSSQVIFFLFSDKLLFSAHNLVFTSSKSALSFTHK